jgi:hypothetical protein
MKKILFLLITITATQVWADSLYQVIRTESLKRENFRSVTVSSNSIESTTDVETRSHKKVFSLSPNASTALGLALETNHLNLSYVFSNNNPEIKQLEATKWHDIRFNFVKGHYDVRLHYQSYKGALIRENGIAEFYSDYRLTGKNVRANYYFNEEHLDYTRIGEKLMEKLNQKRTISGSHSWFLGLNIDQRDIKLPQNLLSQHLKTLRDRQVNYHRSFSALSAGPLGGFDGILFLGPSYGRFKLGLGPAVQYKGQTTYQTEIGLDLGGVVAKNHLISFNADYYSMEFKDSDQRVINQNASVSLAYTYKFF